MPRISDLDVSAANDLIAQAESSGSAWEFIDGLTPAMLCRVLDLNGYADMGRGLAARDTLGAAHGWHPVDRDDFVPADGRGPCYLGGHQPHSRRPAECRGCGRRRIDHRPVRVAG
jgi:hypothetical protein